MAELPALFLDRLRRIVPAEQWDAVAASFAAPKPASFRVNTLKTSAAEAREALVADGFGLEPVPWYPDAFILRRGAVRALQETALYRAGALYLQRLASLLPSLALAPQPGELVLDIAAAPGSKTTHLACLMRGQGRLVANDNHRQRFFRLKANVAQQGAVNVDTTLRYGESFGRQQPEAFDRVLVDAPCSTEGRFCLAEPKTYRFWKPSKTREMVRKQRRLLDAGITALRPGGVLVYATCTFAPEENESVIDWALERRADAVALEPIDLAAPAMAEALPAWEGRAFHPSLRHARRVLPTADMEGFFLARFRKRAAAADGLQRTAAVR